MKSLLSFICASVIPICRSSANTFCISGSLRSNEEESWCTGAGAGAGAGGEGDCTGAITGGGGGGADGVADDELLPRRPLKRERPDFPLDTGAGP